MTTDFDSTRRFGGINTLYGDKAFARLQNARIVVVGVGGVGSWAVEALARSGVGKLTLIDMDHVSESNINRQIQPLTPTHGQAKVQALAERIQLINPTCAVNCIEDFVDAGNAHDLLPATADIVIDACDQVRAKVSLVLWAREHNVRLIVCGGAGGRQDPARLQVGDLARAEGCRLLAEVRHQLRRHHQFPEAPKGSKTLAKTFGIYSIYSGEPAVKPARDTAHDLPAMTAGSPLACAGYGSSVMVTATMGMIAAAEAIRGLTKP